jgi:F-type H+-transporting ATPase subunit b
MDETLRQIGGLLLGAIPTVIFFLLLYGLYAVLVHKPLTRVLAERRARTQGAIEKARADVASAEARTAEHEQKLREARLALFKGSPSCAGFVGAVSCFGGSSRKSQHADRTSASSD